MKKQLFVLLVTVVCLHKDIFSTKCPCPFSYLYGLMYKKNNALHKKNDSDIELTDILVVIQKPTVPISPEILEQPFEPRRTARTTSPTYIPKSLAYIQDERNEFQVDLDFTRESTCEENRFPYSEILLTSPKNPPRHSIKEDSEASWENIDENDL